MAGHSGDHGAVELLVSAFALDPFDLDMAASLQRPPLGAHFFLQYTPADAPGGAQISFWKLSQP